MKELTAVIVDDEYLARSDLKALLSEIGNVEIIGESDNINSAKEILRKSTPDIIFLDIQLPGESGFDLLAHISTITKIIFVTAFDEYAVRAFEINALDYLVKPVNKERLESALNRVRISKPLENIKSNKLDYMDNIFLRLNNSYNFLKINNISKISAADDYSEIFTKTGEKFIVLKSMKDWERRLPEQYFCRIHRSTIVNIDCIDKIEAWFNGAYKVYLKESGESLKMSRHYFSLAKNKLG